MKKEETTNKMGTKSIPNLLLSMGTPMILSMMMQALYNIVDSAFVSNIPGNGEQALNALTLAFPVQMLMVALGIGTGVGVNALLAKSLGQEDGEKVNRTAGNGVLLAGIIYILCVLFGVFGVDAYVGTQTTNSQIITMAVEYLKICCFLSFGIVFFSLYEKILQATGRSLFSTIAQIAGAVTNIVLDPIFIYGLIGCPEMGVKGAAYATVIGQIVSMVVALLFHFIWNKEISNKLMYLVPSGKNILGIYSIGLPAIIAQALMSVMTYGLNVILVTIDEAVVTAYGLFYKIQQFILFAAFGLRDAITPIVSFNHGMRSRQRVKEGIRYGTLYTLCIMVIGLLLLEIFARPISSIFGLSGMTQQFCIDAMRIVSISFLFAGINIAFQGVFQALNSGLESLIISVCRQFLFVLPVVWAFAQLGKQSADCIWTVWLTFPIAEILSAVLSLLFMKRIMAKKVNTME